jgi:hypothetical protein
MVYPSTTLNPSHISHLDKNPTTLVVYAQFYVSFDEIFPKKLRHLVFVNCHSNSSVMTIVVNMRIYMAFSLHISYF